mmetsp:Transcript_17582/g.44628  ORF Transcript_17582/g.44628 Transcript_17582/m.44628 type:complete len:92 (+) Transcript_17582:103-378(+)
MQIHEPTCEQPPSGQLWSQQLPIMAAGAFVFSSASTAPATAGRLDAQLYKWRRQQRRDGSSRNSTPCTAAHWNAAHHSPLPSMCRPEGSHY